MKKWGKRIISGVIAASLLTAAAISGSEQGTGTVASVVQAGTETSFMGKLLEGGYIDVFTSWTQEEQNKFYDGLSPQQQSVFLEVTNCQITRELIKSERSKEELEQFFDRLQPYFLILKKGNQEKPDDEIVIECINQIEGTDYHSSEQYIKQLVSEKKDHYLEFYDALKLVKDGKLEIESAVDDFYKELGFLKKDRVPADSAEVSRQPVQVQKKAAAKAVSDRYSNFKAVSSLKALKDAVASVKKGEKIAVRVDKGFNVTSVIRTNGRHVKIYADGESGHNLNRTAGYKDVMLEVNGGSLTLGAYDGDGRAKNNLYINGKNIAASAPLIEVTSGHLYLNKYSRIIDGYFLADFAGGAGIALNSGTSCYMFGGRIDNCRAKSSKDVSSSSPKSSHGGGVLVGNGSSFYMFAGSIEHCQAIHGGGIMNYGTLRLYGGAISDCAASNQKKDALGGAVKVQGAIETNGKVSSTKGDLGVWKYTRSAAWIVNGKDGYQQGTTTGVVLKNNQADAGGAICLNNGSNGAIQDCNINGNHSTGNGAGICLSNGSYKKGAALELKTGAVIHGNESKGYGGGIYCADSVKGSLSGGTMYDNSAKYGAGIYHEAEFRMSGGTVRSNHSGNSGGGIYAKGKLSMTGGEISANTAATYGGGAILKTVGGSVSRGSIKGNSASANGGGLQIDGTVSLSNASVSSNSASGKGGGISVSSSGTCNLSSGNVSGNTAKAGGGGIYIDGTCKANGSSFTGNQSSGDGGAVYIASGTFTTFQANQAVNIQGNSASGNGSGIYNRNITVLNNNAHILNNQCKNGTQRGIFHEGSLFSIEGNTEIQQEIYLAKDRFVTASNRYFSNSNSLKAKISLDTANIRNGYAVVKGNVSNSADGNYKTGEALLNNQSAGGRFVYAGSGYVMRPGNLKKSSSGCAPFSIVLSQAYQIRYDKNSKEEVMNMPTAAVKYWEEDIKLSALTPTGGSGAFVAWNTKADGTGDGYQPGNVYTANADATLFALWPHYRVEYLPGIRSAAGTTDSQEQNKSEDILLRKNGFRSSEGKFVGWKQDISSARKRMELEPVGYKELKEEREKGKLNHILDFAESYKKVNSSENLDNINSLLDVEDIFFMEGQWDSKPDIILNDKKTFLENEKIKKNDLLKVVKGCYDEEDGELTKKVQIIKLDYTKSMKGYRPETQNFSGGMNDTDVMDTYFMKLEKDETVEVKVTFQAEDSVGNVAEKEGTVCVTYNNPPKLHSQNLAFYQKDIDNNPQTILKEIFENYQVEDIEDDKKGLKVPVSVIDPIPLQIEKLNSVGEHKIVYQAIDSLGKKTKLDSIVYIAENNPFKDSYKYNVRFINKKYLYTLKESSKWKKNEELNAQLTSQLEKTKEDAELKYEFEIKK